MSRQDSDKPVMIARGAFDFMVEVDVALMGLILLLAWSDGDLVQPQEVGACTSR